GALVLHAALAGAQVTKLGSEFEVNTYTFYSELDPSVAAGAGGSFVVVWQSYGQDGYGYGIRGRRFSSSGAPLGGEVAVNTYTCYSQDGAGVAAGPAGNFVVVWQSYSQDGYGYGIRGRRFSSAGAALGGEFQVNTYTTRNQYYSRVASDRAGNFVVVWE